MGLPDLDGSDRLTCQAGQVLMTFVWFGVFEICVLKFEFGFGNWGSEF
jgi:hypothetical protein